MSGREPSVRRHRWRCFRGRWTLALLAIVGVGGGVACAFAREEMVGTMKGELLERVERSPQWRGGKFDNRLPRIDAISGRTMCEFLFGGSKHRTPEAPIPVVRRVAGDYSAPPASGLRATWLGHSTVLLENDGTRVLIDPVWGEHASPVPVAVKRFFAPPLPLEELPSVDAVVVSHNHYDHLDKPTVRTLAERGVRWVVPLGVGEHLRAWGVATKDITELDWWEATAVGNLTVTATPSRHFSGRGPGDTGRTLWAGWAFAGPKHRVFYSGDTALHDEFAEIGQRLGPFDLTMIEVGAYDAAWADVHLGPEQAVVAHRLVRGDVMLPVHWGTFNLAPHGWTEPIERTLAAAQAAGVRVATPKPGEMVEPAALAAPSRWWPDVPWRKAAEAPVQSSGLENSREVAGARAE